MDSLAIATLPRSNSKTCDTFGPRVGQRAATRTGLGGKRFVHLFNGGPVRYRFVAEHVSEGRPGRVVDALCQPGFGKTLGVDIANGDVIKIRHKTGRQLVQEVGPSVSDPGVEVRHLPLLSGALRDSKPVFKLCSSLFQGFISRRADAHDNAKTDSCGSTFGRRPNRPDRNNRRMHVTVIMPVYLYSASPCLRSFPPRLNAEALRSI